MSGEERRKTGVPGLSEILSGNILTLARGITEIENGTLLGVELGIAASELGASARTIGVTGPPGAGKSSLISVLISQLLPYYPRIGVLTVDPSSPVSGGAVLGDRVRMASHNANPGVFIRSLAARGHLGGVTRATRSVIDLLAAAGMDLTIIETVGTGQSEVEIAELTDLKLMVCAPGMGDEMQAIKAGILEVADVLVVNKADLPDADRTVNFLKGMLMHRGKDERRVVFKVSAARHDGFTALVDAVRIRLDYANGAQRTRFAGEGPRMAMARDAAELVMATVRQSADPRIEGLVTDVISGSLGRREAAVEALSLVGRDVRGAKENDRE